MVSSPDTAPTSCSATMLLPDETTQAATFAVPEFLLTPRFATNGSTGFQSTQSRLDCHDSVLSLIDAALEIADNSVHLLEDAQDTSSRDAKAKNNKTDGPAKQ